MLRLMGVLRRLLPLCFLLWEVRGLAGWQERAACTCNRFNDSGSQSRHRSRALMCNHEIRFDPDHGLEH